MRDTRPRLQAPYLPVSSQRPGKSENRCALLGRVDSPRCLPGPWVSDTRQALPGCGHLGAGHWWLLMMLSRAHPRLCFPGPPSVYVSQIPESTVCQVLHVSPWTPCSAHTGSSPERRGCAGEDAETLLGSESRLHRLLMWPWASPCTALPTGEIVVLTPEDRWG